MSGVGSGARLRVVTVSDGVFCSVDLAVLVSDSGPPNFRSIRLGPNPKLTINLN